MLVIDNLRPAEFYRAEDYGHEDSVGLLMKRILASMARQADDLLEPCGLTSVQCAPLMRLKTAGCSTVSEVARSLQVDAGATTRLFDRLERKGHCQRARSGADRRVVTVQLTCEGEAAISAAPLMLGKVLRDHMAGFSDDELHALNLLLLRMINNAEVLRTSGGATD